MENDIQIAAVGQRPAPIVRSAQPTTLTQNGNDNTQIAHVDNFKQNVIIFSGVPAVAMSVFGQGDAFNYDCFNLFVMGTESYEEPYFIVPKNRALTESTSQEIQEQCATLSSKAISIIKTFPALFCSENHHYAKTDPDHMAYYGFVGDIKVQDNGVKIYPIKISKLPQQVLIDLSQELCIGGAKSYTELARTHWAIKRINLVEVLRGAGYPVFSNKIQIVGATTEGII